MWERFIAEEASVSSSKSQGILATIRVANLSPLVDDSEDDVFVLVVGSVAPDALIVVLALECT